MSDKYLLPYEFTFNPRTVAQKNFRRIEERLWYAKPYPGATAGAPTTGTWALDELYRDTDRVLWRCTVAGTPGTWVREYGAGGIDALTPGYYARKGATDLEDGAIRTMPTPNNGVKVLDPLMATAFRSELQNETLTADDQTITVGAGR